MSAENSYSEFSLEINRAVTVPIMFGIAGFIFSALLLYTGCKKNNSIAYHEIYIENKPGLLQNILRRRLHSLNDTINALKDFSKKPAAASALTDKGRDSVAKYETYNKAQTALYNASVELKQITNGNADTSLKHFSSYILVKRDTLLNRINCMDSLPFIISNKDTLRIKDSFRIITTTSFYRAHIPVTVLTKDSCPVLSNQPVCSEDTMWLGKKSQQHLTTFFDSNPAFGFWFFFSIAQMTMWLLLIPLLIGAVQKTDDVVVGEEVKKPSTKAKETSAVVETKKYVLLFNGKNGGISAILPVLCTGLFAVIIYFILINDYVIRDFVFLDNYNDRMKVYGFTGYLVAVLCFTSYLFLSNKLDLLDGSSRPQEERKTDYERLTKVFNFSFLCSVIILSVFIFWVGVLFNAINNTEAMRLYSLQSGKPFLSSDFVYLLGLMHTLLLFIFYVPTRIRFNNLKNTQQKQEAFAGSNPPTATKFWKGLFDILSTVLLTASPLLTSLLQKIIDQVFS